MVKPILICILFLSCTTDGQTKRKRTLKVQGITATNVVTDSSSKFLIDRFSSPNGYTITNSDSASFGFYLQHLPLKKAGSMVYYYDGGIKQNRNVYCGVVDMDLDPVDLQQCADAAMRLRGEYLFQQKRFEEIKFNFLSDGKPRYFKDYAKGDYSYKKFRKYMKYIFSYANTASLCNELHKREIMDMQIGDILVQKGNPYGHAVTVVNMATDTSGNKVFMLAQSYMPAQDTQILINPNSSDSGPWYTLKEGTIQTPEWTFSSADLKHF